MPLRNAQHPLCMESGCWQPRPAGCMPRRLTGAKAGRPEVASQPEMQLPVAFYVAASALFAVLSARQAWAQWHETQPSKRWLESPQWWPTSDKFWRGIHRSTTVWVLIWTLWAVYFAVDGNDQADTTLETVLISAAAVLFLVSLGPWFLGAPRWLVPPNLRDLPGDPGFGSGKLNPNDWLPIRVGTFWDVPRVFALQSGDRAYLFESAHDAERESYADEYSIYRLLTPLPDEGLSGVEHGPRIGKISVDEVLFDESRKKALHRSCLDAIERKFIIQG